MIELMQEVPETVVAMIAKGKVTADVRVAESSTTPSRAEALFNHEGD